MVFKNELVIALTAILPIAELRGSIPLGLYLKEPLLKVFLISVIGNLIPVAPLYFLLEPVSRRLRRYSLFERFFTWLFERTKKKSSLIERYEALGLMIFVAVPLPMTGAWTGCMAASLLKMPFRRAFPAIALGVVMAGIIVTVLCSSGKIVYQGLT